MTNVVWLIVRRMFGIVLVAMATAYVTAMLILNGIYPGLICQSKCHTPQWFGGIYGLANDLVTLPVLIDVPSKERGELTPDKKPEGGLKAVLAAAAAGQITYSDHRDPPVGSGNWYVQGSDGSMYAANRQRNLNKLSLLFKMNRSMMIGKIIMVKNGIGWGWRRRTRSYYGIHEGSMGWRIHHHGWTHGIGCSSSQYYLLQNWPKQRMHIMCIDSMHPRIVAPENQTIGN